METIDKREHFDAQHRYRLARLELLDHLLDQSIGADQQFRQRTALRERTGEDLRGMDQPVIELLHIAGAIATADIQAEVQEGGDSLRIADAIGQLALDGRVLEVGGHFIEHERHIGAGHRDLHQHGVRREVEERQPRARPHDLSRAELNHVRGRWNLDESKAEHERLPRCWDAIVEPTPRKL